MRLTLRRLPATTRGIYGPGRDRMGKRQLLLAPDAAESFARLEAESGGLVYSDIYRSADASMLALGTKKGVQPPGYSAHNYGLAFDVAIEATLALRGWSYSQMLRFLEKHGWWCHRRDGQMWHEAWHLNFLGGDAETILAPLSVDAPGTWSRAAEAAIVKRHAQDFAVSTTDVQAMLQKLGMYRGELDGTWGPLSHEARRAFERAWLGGAHDSAKFERTLALVAADVVIEE